MLATWRNQNVWLFVTVTDRFGQSKMKGYDSRIDSVTPSGNGYAAAAWPYSLTFGVWSMCA